MDEESKDTNIIPQEESLPSLSASPDVVAFLQGVSLLLATCPSARVESNDCCTFHLIHDTTSFSTAAFASTTTVANAAA